MIIVFQTMKISTFDYLAENWNKQTQEKTKL